MATMIPTEPYEYTENSMEGYTFNCFKQLPDDYYVFHSFKMNQIDSETNDLNRHEIDFLIYHPKYGILCIEQKHGDTGKIVYKEGYWYFLKKDEEGKLKRASIMKYGGPFRQAEARKEDISTYIGNREIKLDGYKDEPLKKHCKVTYAVCFPGMRSDEEIKYYYITQKGKKEDKTTVAEMLQNPGTPEELVIFGDDLEEPVRLQEKIEKIFKYKMYLPSGKESNSGVRVELNTNTDGKFEVMKYEGNRCDNSRKQEISKIELEGEKKLQQLLGSLKYIEIRRGEEIKTGIDGKPLSEKDTKNLFDLVLCPNYNIVETIDPNTGETKFIRLNEDQISVLELLLKKREMAVSGMAGTGKTILALQLARKKVMQGEHVLFLCRSSYQKQELEKSECNSKIDFRDIDWFTRIKPDEANGKSFYKALSEELRLEKFEEVDLREQPTRKKDFYKSRYQNKLNPVSIDSEEFCKEFEEKDLKKKPDRKKKFRYEIHTIIVDEAQDFCKGFDCDVLNDLYSSIQQNRGETFLLKQEYQKRIAETKVSFYIFYDEFQAEDKTEILRFAQNIKNHIELEKNCRNSINITKTVLRPLVDIPSYYCQRKDNGSKVKIDFYEEGENLCLWLDNLLCNLEYNLNPEDTVILTFKSNNSAESDHDKKSVLLDYPERLIIKDGIQHYKVDNKCFPFTNWKNYQGLEKRNIVFVDFEPFELFEAKNESYAKMFYVAISRAQDNVYILTLNTESFEGEVSDIEESDLKDFINNVQAFCEVNLDYDDYSYTDLSNLEEKIRNDPKFKNKVNGAKHEIRGFEKLSEQCKISANVLEATSYVLDRDKEEIEESKQKLNEYQIRVMRLNESYVEVYRHYRDINKRVAICAALNAESIHYYDVVISETFKKFLDIGKKATRLGVTAETLHHFILDMIKSWNWLVILTNMWDNEPDLKRADVIDYQSKGVDLEAFWDCREKIIRDTKSAWDNFLLFVDAELKPKDFSIKQGNMEELKCLAKEAMLCFRGAIEKARDIDSCDIYKKVGDGTQQDLYLRAFNVNKDIEIHCFKYLELAMEDAVMY